MNVHEQILKNAGLESKAQVSLKVLSKTDSLKPLIGWIQEALKKVNAKDIVLGFDVDGTLTDLDPTKKGIKKEILR